MVGEDAGGGEGLEGCEGVGDEGSELGWSGGGFWGGDEGGVGLF